MNKIILMTILLLPMIGSIIGYVLGWKSREKYRDLFNITMTGLVFLLVTYLYKAVRHGTIEVFIPDIMVTGLYLKLDMFRYIFVWITCFVWFLTTIYSTQYLIKYKNRNRYYAFFMLTLGSTIGVFLSENILNLFTFFEIMSFTSYALVIHDEDQYAHDAGQIYIGMAIGGGLILLLGIFLLFDYTGTLNISEYPLKMAEMGGLKYLISTLLLIGFGIKASMVPLHVWMPKAHPAAPAPASAVLSGILIKTGIFGIMILSGYIMKDDQVFSMILLVGGLTNMLLGSFLAMFQRNIKRILAYSSMSHAGYILVGVGLMGILTEHKAVAIYGALYHVLNHALFKVLLFMGAGIIYMILHELSINEIKGFGRNKTLLKIIFLVGVLAVAGMPGFNGFISKTLLHEALAEAHHQYSGIGFTIAEIVFTLSSAFSLAYLLKIFVAVFIEKNEAYSGQYKSHVRAGAIIPALIISVVIIWIGVRPFTVLHMLEGAVESFGYHGHLEAHFYTMGNLKATGFTMLLGVIIYLGFVRTVLRRKDANGENLYVNPALNWFNLENHVYIPLGVYLFELISEMFHFIDQGMIRLVKATSGWMIALQHIEIRPDRFQQLKKKLEAGIGRKPLGPIEDIQLVKETAELSVKTKSYVQEVVHDIGEEIYSLSDVVQRVGRNMNTLMFSVLSFAVILAIALVVMIY
ncbi:MAG: dehydrogenase [Anaerosolibacter sp.]|uniref:complex I subunit 5 family protein n=1 Tax=Anaerosolibacter sp. TaxID=1872527 RepID=UPI00261A9E3D|nr:complex I subunit 5 family protein [Anaerosolibacter sp.]MDF2546722.1 dehydrogenase [Anaerosolibacter sp.]